MSKKPFDKDAAKAKTDSLRQTVDDFAKSVLNDTSGDAAFKAACDLAKLPHRYSWGNLLLIWCQAPESALVCSKSAFDAMAAKQGHKLTPFAGKKQHVRIAKGSQSVAILAPRTFVVKETNDDGEEVTRSGRYFKSVGIFKAEDILYCDTNTPFEVPTIFGNVTDGEDLFAKLEAFAVAKGITVNRTALLSVGHDGTSYGGSVDVRNGNDAGAVHPLIHELAHELLHPLAERGNDRDREQAKKFAEAEAESVAAAVLRTLGHDVATSASYLRNHGCTPHDVTRSLDRIVGAAQEILTWLREGKLIEKHTAAEEEGEAPAEVAA